VEPTSLEVQTDDEGKPNCLNCTDALYTNTNLVTQNEISIKKLEKQITEDS
jgi:hypothetical protein